MFKINIVFIILISQSFIWAIHCATPFKTLPPPQSTLNPQKAQVLGPTFLSFEYPGQNTFALDKVYKSKNFSIHYTVNGASAVDPTDSNSNFIPDYVETISTELEKIWNLYISDDLWNAPPVDQEGFYHVYISELSPVYYGYVEPYKSIGDNPKTSEKEVNAYESYMALRNSYEKFQNPQEALLATLAHEFLHSIQFGYDAFEEKWLLEGQATSMEGWVYPDSKDNFQFVQTWFEYHDASISYDSFVLNENPAWAQMVYSIWPFFFELYNQFGGLSIGAEISKGSLLNNSQYLNTGIRALNAALANYGTNFKEVFKNYAINSFLIDSDLEANVPYSLKQTFRDNLSLKLRKEVTLKVNPPYIFQHFGNDQYLRGGGFDLIELNIGQASNLSFITTNKKENIKILVLDTLEGVQYKEYTIDDDNSFISLDSTMINRPIQVFIFNFDHSSINLEYEIQLLASSPKLDQFCLNEANLFECGALYNLKGQRLGTGTSDFLGLEEGYYLQKKGTNNRPLIFR